MAAAVSFSRSRKPKVKWTNQMNNDVLEYKRRAQELVASKSTPLNRNGRKKGYIEVMKQLWEEKGYGHLALKGQNLRDQASRLEKCQEGLADESCVYGATVISIDESILPTGNSDTVFVEGNRNIESEINSGLETPSSFVLGQYDEGRSITVNVSTIENAYDEISKWRKNTFLVPFGKTEKEFIERTN